MASRFGISTHLFHADRLRHDHLAAVARAGFDTVELYATRTHFDYHEPAAATELAGWLDDTRLSLHAVHAPSPTHLRAAAAPREHSEGCRTLRRNLSPVCATHFPKCLTRSSPPHRQNRKVEIETLTGADWLDTLGTDRESFVPAHCRE